MKPPRYQRPSKDELRALIEAAPKTPEERYLKTTNDLATAPDIYNRWCSLGSAAKACLETNRLKEAKQYAEELEKLTPNYTKDWNYGNAIQDSNVVKGVIAVRKGDFISAREHLLSAGRSPGSPQMNSFGPNLLLAAALLEVGETEVVLDYFDLCRSFWKLDRNRLDTWSKTIKDGGNPSFGANLLY